MTKQEFTESIERGPYAFPGGYPVFYLTRDGEALSFQAAADNAELIADVVEGGNDPQWQVVTQEINWESELYCAHTGEQIEAAYDIAQ